MNHRTQPDDLREERINTASGHQVTFFYSREKGVESVRATVRMPPGYSGISVRVVFRITERGREVQSIDIAPSEGVDVTWRMLRAIPIETLQREVDESIRRFLNGELGPSEVARELNELFRTQPGRRRRYTKLDYARLAERYVDLSRNNEPTKALADELHLSRSRVRDLLSLARRNGLLTTNGQGASGGELTADARALLGLED